MTPITLEQLRTIMPQAPATLPDFVDPLNATMQEWEINTKGRACAFIANLAHESAQFQFMEEIASGAAYDHRVDLGNREPEAIAAAAAHNMTTGRFYRGHGPIQVTGYYNHRDCGAALLLDLVHSPRLLTLPAHGCRAAGWFWKTRGCNELADAGKFEAIVRRINGGLNGLADRMMFWDRATAAL